VSYRGTHVELDVRALDAGALTTIQSPRREEAVVVLLDGEVVWNGLPARRHDVFGDRAAALYLAPGTSVEIAASAPSEIAVATTVGCELSAPPSAPVVVGPDDVVVHERGRPGWRRAVHDVVADAVPAQRLIVGETFNEPGEWSSFPPHKHDGTDGEPALEEVYYFRFDDRNGFGFQGLYEAHGDERAVFLRHGTIVGIPRGYHPVCAAPGYRLYYLWVLVGKPRRLAMHEDPAHRWLTT
jgi:5-deoxy-glucuronate isomerase